MTKPDSKTALLVGVAGLAVTALGILVSGSHAVATSVGVETRRPSAVTTMPAIPIPRALDASGFVI